MMPRCTCAVGPPCALCEGTWYCSSCYSAVVPENYNCGDKLRGHQQHRGRSGRTGLLAPPGATVRPVRRQGGHTRKPVPFAVCHLSVTTRPVRRSKDSQ